MFAPAAAPSPRRLQTPSVVRGIPIAALVLVLAAVTGSPLAAQDPLKIAVVDLDRVIIESPGGQALQAELLRLQGEAQAQLDASRRTATELQQRAATTTDPDELRRLQNQIEDANLAARRTQDDAQRRANKLQEEKLGEIRTQLQPVFDKLREDEGYDLILNNTPGVVVMSGPRVDITQQVLESLVATSGD